MPKAGVQDAQAEGLQGAVWAQLPSPDTDDDPTPSP